MPHGRTDRPAAGWRLLVEPPQDAATNMAVDEALLEAYRGPAGEGLAPTLRLYGWNPAALSLGKNQPAPGSHDGAFLRREGLDLVRRPTGGQAVLHEGERTYAVVGRLDRPPFHRGVLATYEAVSAALRLGLARLGVETVAATRKTNAAPGPVCFNVAASHELLNRGRKVLGSAQMRRGRAFLQHGSIPYRSDAARLGAAIGVPADGDRFSGLEDLLGRRPADDEVDRALIEGFEHSFEIALVPRPRSPEENARVEWLRCWKYLSTCWTFEGKVEASGVAR